MRSSEQAQSCPHTSCVSNKEKACAHSCLGDPWGLSSEGSEQLGNRSLFTHSTQLRGA